MKQIRICRADHIQHLKQKLVAFDAWVEETPEQLTEFRIIVATGNDLFGAQTHWIEHRMIDRNHELPDRAIVRVVNESMRAWCEGDMHRHMSFYTDGAFLITPQGSCHRGRAGLYRIHEQTRARMPGVGMSIERCDISYPANKVAVLMLAGRFRHEQLPGSARWSGMQTQVQEGARWKIAGMQVFNEAKSQRALAA